MTSSTLDAPRIRSLASAARTLGRSAALTAMVEIAAEEARKALPAASVSISRLEPGTGAIRTLINVGVLGPGEERWPENEVYRLADFRYLQAVVADLHIWTTTVDDVDCDPGERALLRSLHKGSSIGAPLVVDGKLWGEFYATREIGEQPFDDNDAAYTEALSAILAGAISRALHIDSLEALAFKDPLTGLANRRALDDAAGTAFASLGDQLGRRVTVVALDLNRLKVVNDTLGHAEGDRLITAVAALLQTRFAHLHGSLVARVGGDEFMVLVPGHPLDEVMAAAQAVCDDAARLSVGSGLSCGVASTRTSGVGVAHQVFRAADAAQYDAKRGSADSPRLVAV